MGMMGTHGGRQPPVRRADSLWPCHRPAARPGWRLSPARGSTEPTVCQTAEDTSGTIRGTVMTGRGALKRGVWGTQKNATNNGQNWGHFLSGLAPRFVRLVPGPLHDPAQSEATNARRRARASMILISISA